MAPSECRACEGRGWVEVLVAPSYETRGRVPHLRNCVECRGTGKIIHVVDGHVLTEEEAARLDGMSL